MEPIEIVKSTAKPVKEGNISSKTPVKEWARNGRISIFCKNYV